MTPVVLVLLLFVSLTAIPAGTAWSTLKNYVNQETPIESTVQSNFTDVSEPIFIANGNRKSLKEGDVAKPTTRNARRCPFRTCRWQKCGRYVPVPFYIHSGFNASERNIILQALALLNKHTCIQFIHWSWILHRLYPDYIYFVPGTGCWSYVGRTGGRQYISLRPGLCVYPGMVHHSLLHTLGFHHEHSRWDRFLYVKILYENILPGTERNFASFFTNNLGTRYNYRSIMHYGRYAFSKNNQPTIESTRDPNAILGNSMITYGDVYRVNRLYRC